MKVNTSHSQNSILQAPPPGTSRNKYLVIIVIILGGLSYFISTGFPAPLKIEATELQVCPEQICAALQYNIQTDVKTEDPIIIMEISDLSSANQFISFQALPIIKDRAKKQDFTLELEVSSFQVYPDRRIQRATVPKTHKEVEFHCTNQDGQVICHPQALAGVDKVVGEKYIFVAKLLNLMEKENEDISKVMFSFITLNPEFQDYLSYFKYGLFAIALISLLLYKRSFHRIPLSIFSSEHVFVLIMGVLVVLLNEPYFKYSSLNLHFTYSIIVVLVRALHSSLIILFWLYLLERLSSADDTVSDGAKILIWLIAIAHFCMTAAIYVMLAYDQQKNPFIDLEHEHRLSFTIYRHYVFWLLVGGSAYTATKVFSIFPERAGLSWRDKVSVISFFFYIVCYVTLMNTGSLQALNLKGNILVLFYSFTTLYTIMLQVMYAPFNEELEDIHERERYDSKSFQEVNKSSQVDDVHLKNFDEMKHKSGSRSFDN